MRSFARRSLFTLALMVPFAMAFATETGPAITGSATPPPPPTAMTPDQAREEYAYALGIQAYLYGYPSIEMYRVRNHAIYDPASKTQTTINQFHHRRELVVPNATTVVAPNNDTLYSSAWLDLAREPVVLDVPDTAGRYYVMQFMDFYTNDFAYVGKRSTGTAAGSYVVTGPGWKGEIPAGTKQIESPTNEVWLLGRTLVDGPEDLPAVYALQAQYRLTPLSRWHQAEGTKGTADKVREERPAPPPYDLSDPLRFFELLDVVLHANPPPARDAVLMSQFAAIGVGPDKTFRAADLDAPIARGLRRAIDTAQQLIAALPSGRPAANGWMGFSDNTGVFGDDYRYRAYIAKFALAANVPAEARNFSTVVDAHGDKLTGSEKYLLRFEPGQLPPVDAFWSMTMYGIPGGMLVPNPIGRYSLGDRSKQLQYGKDGSLEIYVQHDSPGPAHESNWLPAPSGTFDLSLRCYMPKPALIDGHWVPPAVKRVN